MKYGYLTPEERAANAEELAKIKELVIKWLKKISQIYKRNIRQMLQ